MTRQLWAPFTKWLLIYLGLYALMLIGVEVLTPSAWNDDPGPLLKLVLKGILNTLLLAYAVLRYRADRNRETNES